MRLRAGKNGQKMTKRLKTEHTYVNVLLYQIDKQSDRQVNTQTDKRKQYRIVKSKARKMTKLGNQKGRQAQKYTDK